MRRWLFKSVVKALGSTQEVLLILGDLNVGEGARIPSVVVKYVDIRWNTGGEAGCLAQH